MYDPGRGIFNDVSGSLHNIPMHMQDNGRVAPQVQTPGQIQIYNPVASMSNSEIEKNMKAYGAPMDPSTHTGPGGYFQTRIHNAAMYSTMASEMYAREQRDSANFKKSALGIAQTASMFLGLTGIGTPLALGIQGGLAAADYFMDDGEAYYKGFSNRRADIQGIQQAMRNAGTGIVNPMTGQVSARGATDYLNLIPGIAQGTGMTTADIHGISTMGMNSGLISGSSVNDLGSKLKQVAQMTKHLMDVSAGISAQDAMEIQRLANQVGVVGSTDVAGFGKRLINAAKLTGRTIEQVGMMASQGASLGVQAGIGRQAGAEIAVFNDLTIRGSYAAMSQAERARVGGSQQEYMNRLNTAHAKFSAQISSSLVGQSAYVDPETGRLEIDDADVASFEVGHKAARRAQRRLSRLYSGRNARLLSNAGINKGLIQSALRLQSSRLAEDAAAEMDPEERMRYMLKTAMVESERIGMTPEEYLQRTLGKNEAEAVLLQAKKFSAGARQRGLDAYKTQLEKHATIAAQEIADDPDISVSRDEKTGRVAATLSAELAERAQEEAVGLFRRRRSNRNLKLDDLILTEGVGYIVPESKKRSTAMNYYTGAQSELTALGQSMSLSDLFSLRKGQGFEQSLVGKYLANRSRAGEDSYLDFGMTNGLISDITSSFSDTVQSLSDSELDMYSRNAKVYGSNTGLSDDIAILKGATARGASSTVGQILARHRGKLSAGTLSILENMDQSAVFNRKSISELLATTSFRGDLKAAEDYDAIVNDASKLDEALDIGKNATEVNKAVAALSTGLGESRERGVGGTVGAIDSALRDAGINMANKTEEEKQELRNAVYARAARGTTTAEKKLAQQLSKTYADVKMVSGADLNFDSQAFLEDNKGFKKTLSESTTSYFMSNNDEFSSTDLLFGEGVKGTEISAERARESLINLRKGTQALGGADVLKTLVRAARLDSFDSGYSRADLKKVMGNKRDFLNLLKGKVDKKTLKQVEKLFDSGDEAGLQAVMQVVEQSTRRRDDKRLGGQIEQQLDEYLSQGSAEINRDVLANLQEDLGSLGDMFGPNLKSETIKRIVTGDVESALRQKSYSAYTRGVGGTDATAALKALDIDTTKLDEHQRRQIEELYSSTVGDNLGDDKSFKKFMGEMKKILNESRSDGAQGKKDRSTTETEETIAAFNRMIEATGEILKALTLPDAEAAKAISTARTKINQIANSVK